MRLRFPAVSARGRSDLLRKVEAVSQIAVDTGHDATLWFATMNQTLILVVGKRVGKAV